MASREGLRYPSVTELIPRPTFYCSPEQLEAARLDGEQKHSMIESYFTYGETFDEPYTELFAEWYIKQGWDHPISEERIISDNLKLTGKPDLLFLNHGVILDIKRTIGSDLKHRSLQMAGYSILVNDKYGVRLNRWIMLEVDMKLKTPKVKTKDVFDINAESIFNGLKDAYWANKNYEEYMRRDHV